MVRKNLTMLTSLFILALLVFAYMLYVLLRPERF
ncbi:MULTISPECIES: potassium-transporting ATPase subunit F [Rudanella]|nr:MULTISPECIES: potassium-transporting ATPase subunit F [Rudanella]